MMGVAYHGIEDMVEENDEDVADLSADWLDMVDRDGLFRVNIFVQWSTE